MTNFSKRSRQERPTSDTNRRNLFLLKEERKYKCVRLWREEMQPDKPSLQKKSVMGRMGQSRLPLYLLFHVLLWGIYTGILADARSGLLLAAGPGVAVLLAGYYISFLEHPSTALTPEITIVVAPEKKTMRVRNETVAQDLDEESMRKLLSQL